MAILDGSESVLVTPAEELDRIGSWQGFYPCQRFQAGHWQRLLLNLAEFRLRTEELEHGEAGLAWKQVIPYAVLSQSESVFCFRRPAKGGDTRLAGRLSIGVGGHLNPIDGRAEPETVNEFSRTLHAGLCRELREEVGILGPFFRMVGLLRDDRNDVGKRHVGLVYACVADPAEVIPQSAEIEPVGWLTPAELRAMPGEDWETWSAILVDAIDQVIRLVPA